MENLLLIPTVIGVSFIYLFTLFLLVFLVRKFKAKKRTATGSLTKDKVTALTFCGILGARNNRNFSSLAGYSKPRLKIEAISIEGSLNNEWGIYTREELISTILWLRYEGHRLSSFTPSYKLTYSGLDKFTYNHVFLTYINYKKNNIKKSEIPTSFIGVFKILEPSYNKLLNKYGFNKDQLNNIPSLLAWDLERLINLVIFGYSLGYLKEEEAWQLIEESINENIGEFSSWEDYFASFIFGRALWLGDGKFHSTYEAKILLLDKNSIYKKIPYPNRQLSLI